MIVLDANILIRAVLGRRVRHLIEGYAEAGVRFLIPQAMLAEAQEHLPELLDKMGVPAVEARRSIEYLMRLVELVDHDAFAAHEQEARYRLRGRDEEDWPVLATALALNCPIWTEDTDFFGTGSTVWTTKNVEIYLRSQLKSTSAANEE
jgi:predicted nucleic acid-binding protein